MLLDRILEVLDSSDRRLDVNCDVNIDQIQDT